MFNQELLFLWICNSPLEARNALDAGVDWIFVDIETEGKSSRQPTTSFISDHELDDVQVIKNALPNARVILRINPVYGGTRLEIERAVDLGVDAIMLPMFRSLAEV